MPTPTELTNEPAKKLAIAVEAAKLGIWEWNLRDNTFVYSKRAKEIFGFAADVEVTRDLILTVLHPGDHLLMRDQAARAMEPNSKREPYRYRIHRADTGEMRWLHAFGEPLFENINGTPVAVRFIGTVQDVTEEVVAQQRLADEEARLRLAIEASGIAIWELDLANQTVTHSPELNRLCGFPPDARPTLEELRSRYAPGERERLEREGAAARARGETSFQTEIHHIWPDGTEKWLSLRAQVAPGETGYGGRVIGALVDITEQKRKEEQLGLLLAEFSHRIKNSFSVLQSIVSQTLQGESVSEEARSKLAGRLRAMAYAHDLASEGAWNNASLSEVVRRTLQAFDGYADRVEVSLDETRISARAALSFTLVLHELLTNAIKYGALSNQVGKITLEVARQVDEGDTLLIWHWDESGGPVVAASKRVGFGTRLIDRVFAAEYHAQIERDLRPSGLSFKMKVPLNEVV
jgi:PAS domain S-box-containing protein